MQRVSLESAQSTVKIFAYRAEKFYGSFLMILASDVLAFWIRSNTEVPLELKLVLLSKRILQTGHRPVRTLNVFDRYVDIVLLRVVFFLSNRAILIEWFVTVRTLSIHHRTSSKTLHVLVLVLIGKDGIVGPL